MSLTLAESVAVLVQARDRRGRNVFVDETRWAPRDPTVPHAFEPRRYSNGFDIHVSDACWCDGLAGNPIHEVAA